jgi:hypothetical protein
MGLLCSRLINKLVQIPVLNRQRLILKEKTTMSRTLQLVMAVAFIIIGGWIIFFDGRGWCIACRTTIDTVLGIVAIVLGLIALANYAGIGARADSAVNRQ